MDGLNERLSSVNFGFGQSVAHPVRGVGLIPRNRWAPSIGIGGPLRLEWVGLFRRNRWASCVGIRSQTMKHLFQGLENAFAYFGGVPAELLFDQMKAVIIQDDRDDGGRVLENPEFLRFAHHWGFRIRACRPYRAQTKGKVERPIGYVRTGFFYGRAFIHDEDLNHQARSWIDTTANVRIHGTLKERPIDRFKEEQHLLRPLAPRPYRSLVLPPEPKKKVRTQLPRIEVEHRPLSAYAQLTGGPS